MKTDIIYRDITRTEGLEQFIREHTEEHLENFFQKDEGAHLTVRIEMARRRTNARKPHYSCELILKPTHSRKLIKVQKTDSEFKICIAKSIEALKKIVNRAHAKKQTVRRVSTNKSAAIKKDDEVNESAAGW